MFGVGSSALCKMQRLNRAGVCRENIYYSAGQQSDMSPPYSIELRVRRMMRIVHMGGFAE